MLRVMNCIKLINERIRWSLLPVTTNLCKYVQKNNLNNNVFFINLINHINYIV